MVRAVVFSSVLLALVVVAACTDASSVDEPCTGIPSGGCPRSRGVACEDPTCAAVYLCRPDNVWELERTCPPRAPSGAVDAASDAAADAIDASIKAPAGAFGGAGCAPLQEPDCTLGLALSCGVGCCGCLDLFVCTDRAWDFWGTCDGARPVPAR